MMNILSVSDLSPEAQQKIRKARKKAKIVKTKATS